MSYKQTVFTLNLFSFLDGRYSKIFNKIIKVLINYNLRMPPKRRNSYTTAFKLEVIKYAEENGNRLSARIKSTKRISGAGENRRMYWK